MIKKGDHVIFPKKYLQSEEEKIYLITRIKKNNIRCRPYKYFKFKLFLYLYWFFHDIKYFTQNKIRNIWVFINGLFINKKKQRIKALKALKNIVLAIEFKINSRNN